MRKDEKKAGQWNYRQMGDYQEIFRTQSSQPRVIYGEGSGISCQVPARMTVESRRWGKHARNRVRDGDNQGVKILR